MIDWLEIQHLAIADHIELEFGNSFTAVTGETGSGKSLIVDAVGILLGDRCDNSWIRHKQDIAQIQGGFLLGNSHAASKWLTENGLNNNNECILRRVIRRDKPSRAYINGHAVTASQLRELGRDLVDIHGQNEHHSLLNRKVQLTLLDSAAGNAESVIQLGECYDSLMVTRKLIDRLNDQSDAAQERADLLRFQISELKALDPKPGEWPELEAQQKRMHHAQDLVTGTQSVAERLYESDGDTVSTILLRCCQQLQQLADYDPQLIKIITMLEEANVNVEESAKQLQSFYSDTVLNAEEMADIEARFSHYHEFSRKHRVIPDMLADKLDSMQSELSGLVDPDSELERLTADWTDQKARYDKLASAISRNRHKAADQLAEKVTRLMQELGMEGGSFEIQLPSAEAESISRQGNETVEFMVTANAGMPLQLLAKVASGGELSRISLAIQVVLAADAAVSTLIFDEVDVGIGGKVAEIVGQKLRQLGDNRQVICITHLSQVAAKGHDHWSVAKQSGKQVNVSVRCLSGNERIEEIARMSAGAELTPQSLAHAEQLLQSA